MFGKVQHLEKKWSTALVLLIKVQGHPAEGGYDVSPHKSTT